MTNLYTIRALVASSPNGVITSSQVTEAGLHRGLIQELVCYGRGLYLSRDAWEDDFYLLQRKMSEGFFHTIPRCICWAILTALLQNIR